MQSQAHAVIPGPDPALRGMFEARKRVFVDHLGWDVPVLAGRYEMDQFDTSEATYLVLDGGNGDHRASTRLLRTDRPHILSALFPELCAGPAPQSRAIREITRFCIDPSLGGRERRDARNQLVSAVVEYALQEGVESYTAVANLPWFRQIEQFGWECTTLGPQRRMGNEILVALHISIDAETPEKLARTGIFRPSGFRRGSLAGEGS